jgi:hypothetical protein
MICAAIGYSFFFASGLVVDSDDEEDDDEDDDFGDEYRSLYQPPPFRMNAPPEISRSSGPPHASHLVIGSSEIFWKYSKCLPHF